ncbi:NUDIX hydrolase [Bacillus haynesii]|uniref:NUDIX hydrolase n=1 Tax=Bacillus haynesii TaxID=1925021 RepID=UPI00227ED262|nr:NUDIX domain-containing protein [Bacillus haynesii]MCY8590168.1 NUDIX domain-containing protein [Bacillus haynesii]
MEGQVFGHKIDGLDYQKRKGVYAVIFNLTKEKVLTVQTARGHHFLPGGGIKTNETQKSCLERELLEETGYEVSSCSFIGKSMNFFQSIKNEPILSEGYFYLAKLGRKIQEPLEDDHYLKWISVDCIQEVLLHEHHIWAVTEGLNNN